MLVVNSFIHIPANELKFTYARSSGPGGQNVNKVNTKAILHFDITHSYAIPLEVRSRFIKRFQNKLTQKGVLVLSSDQFRDQARNREACLEKLRTMLSQVLAPPKKRRKTKPSKTSIEKAKLEKKRHKEKKHFRKKPNENE